MQRNIKNKISFFTFGLLAGVTIGVVFGVAIKALLGHFNTLNLGILKIGSRQDEISQRLDSIEGKISNQNKKVVVMPVTKNNGKVTSQLFGDNARRADTATVARSVDKRDSVALAKRNYDSTDVVVMTNQLVNSSSISIVDMDSTVAKKKRAGAKSDSLITEMNDMPQEKYPTNCRVEFWQSPLNFKGYKMSMGKIILYGINSNSLFKLVKLDDVFYLVSKQDAFKVDYTDDLKPFDRVTDKSVLKKISL